MQRSSLEGRARSWRPDVVEADPGGSLSPGDGPVAVATPPTRRQFLAGGLAAAAGTWLGCHSSAGGGRFDVCVIGSGFAGVPLAARCAEAGLHTALVEAGAARADAGRRFDFTTSGAIDYPANTTRMIGSARAVVDRDHAVFGVDNLFVSGAAVFPTAGTSNPTLTVVALTLRLADRLIERYG